VFAELKAREHDDDDLEILCDACHVDAHLPRNRKMREREACGQLRLFDR
jgi:hypothetical protein